MKILLVNKFHYHKGGAETYYFSLADALTRAGHEVIFFSMKSSSNIPCKQEQYFVTNREYIGKSNFLKKVSAAKNIVYSKEAYKKMNQLLDNEKPDLAILSNIHRQLTTSIVDALFEHHIKIYWTVHDLIMLCPNYTMIDGKGRVCEDCCKGNYKNCLRKKCVKNSLLKSYLAVKEAKYNFNHHTYNKIDLFITPSEFYRSKLIQYGFSPSKVIHISNPLPLDTQYEINDYDEGYILYFGRLSYEKGIKTLIDSMNGVDSKLKIVGTGPIEDELKLYVKSKEILNVEFLGFRQGNDLKNIIRNSRCVVLPSEWYENGPYSAMEAMALGKPLIVSNEGGLPELVLNGINGFVYENKDDLKNKINDILRYPDYRFLSENSMEIAKEKFNSNKYIEKVLKND